MHKLPENPGKRRIVVGIVTTWFERGAAYVSDAYRRALSEAYPVFIYARGGEEYAIGDPRWDREYVTWGKKLRFSVPNAIDWTDFRAWVRERGITHLIFNEQWTWDVILRCRYQLKVCVGAYVDYYTPRTVSFFKYYDFLLCNTQRHYSVFRNHPQVLYVPWGTDIEVFNPEQTSRRGRDEVVFFHSCGLSPFRKGTDILVAAFRQVAGNSRLVIHSQGRLKLDDALRKTMAEDKRIEIIEQERGAPGFYTMGDVYVYPARLDGIGLTVPEALASGLPVITTNSAPMNEFVIDNVNGKLVDVESELQREDQYFWPMSKCSEGKLAEAMQWYVDNCSLLPDLKRKAREYAQEFLDWGKNSSALARQIENLGCLKVPLSLRMLISVSLYHFRLSIPHWFDRLRMLLSRLGAGRAKRKLVGIYLSAKAGRFQMRDVG